MDDRARKNNLKSTYMSGHPNSWNLDPSIPDFVAILNILLHTHNTTQHIIHYVIISWIKFEIFGRKSASAIPISLSTSHPPGFQIKPCHSTSLSISQALIFNSSYVNPTFTFKTYQPLAFKFSRVTQLGFQIKLCHSTLLLLSLNSQSCLMKIYYKMRY